MKVKKYLHPEKEGEESGPHTVKKLQRGQGVLRDTFVKTVPMMFFESTADTNTIFARNNRKTNHHVLIT
jgi:hypothetical protein